MASDARHSPDEAVSLLDGEANYHYPRCYPSRPSSRGGQPGTQAILHTRQTVRIFQPTAIQHRDDPRVIEIAAAARNAVEKTYPSDSTQARLLKPLCSIQYAIPTYADQSTPMQEVQEALTRVRNQGLVLVRQVISDLKEDLEHFDGRAQLPEQRNAVSVDRSAFVVHGRDEGAREAVARFLEKLEIRPIVLHEQANKGRTIIEKFEDHGDVPFAVVLLTPDDVGGLSGDPLQPRARQNVILELGYFIGSLGRARVCALQKGSVESPSDVLGIGYIEYDDSGGWRQKLAKELDEAGIEVDWNKVMKA